MKFASAITAEKDPEEALEALCRKVESELAGLPAHLVLWFVNLQYRASWEGLSAKLRSHFRQAVFLGVSGGGVIGENEELEFVPAMSLLAAHLPNVALHPFEIQQEETGEANSPYFWSERLGITPEEAQALILFPEPFSIDAMGLAQTLNHLFPRVPLVGGLASGAEEPRENLLFLNDALMNTGAVGLAVSGDIRLDTVVAQGCRPIGRTFIVTRAERDVIFELASQPAAEVLREVLLGLSDSDKKLARHSLFIGVVSNELKEEFKRGDFLVRHLMAVDFDHGAIQMGDRIEAGQTIQFQLRDAAASRDDLVSLLSAYAESRKKTPPPAGALLFSCLGRGRALYGRPHHDVRLLQEMTGLTAIGGFFCNGEIGPIAGKAFVHGYTSSIGLLGPKGDG